jgi:hypothetical protein
VWAYFQGGPHDGGGGEVPGHGAESRYPPLAVVTSHGARYQRARPLKVVHFQGENAVVYDYDATIDASR